MRSRSDVVFPVYIRIQGLKSSSKICLEFEKNPHYGERKLRAADFSFRNWVTCL